MARRPVLAGRVAATKLSSCNQTSTLRQIPGSERSMAAGQLGKRSRWAVVGLSGRRFAPKFAAKSKFGCGVPREIGT